VEDATCKNTLYLSGESVEWFLVKDFEPIFQCSKSPLDGHPEARVSKIEQLPLERTHSDDTWFSEAFFG
jgi:hypothetical protein